MCAERSRLDDDEWGEWMTDTIKTLSQSFAEDRWEQDDILDLLNDIDGEIEEGFYPMDREGFAMYLNQILETFKDRLL